MILRLNGHHFAGPTQLLPTVGDPDETDLALKAFTQALKVAGGTDKGEQVKVPQGSFDWKEYRAATKAVLAAMANSLRNSFPDSWSFNATIPRNLLTPAGSGCDRVEMVEMEKRSFENDPNMKLFFNYDYRTFEASPQWYLDESFHRLIYSADEGTEASVLKLTIIDSELSSEVCFQCSSWFMLRYRLFVFQEECTFSITILNTFYERI